MPRIEKMWAFVMSEQDDPNDEGVPAWRADDGSWYPLVGADLERVESLRLYAQALVNATGRPARLLEFSVCTELEVLKPNGVV